MSTVCVCIRAYAEQEIDDIPLLLSVHKYFFQHLLSCRSEWIYSHIVYIFYIELYLIQHIVEHCPKQVRLYY